MKLDYKQLKELLKNVEDEVTNHPWIRPGQAMFNILVSTYPDFEYIRTTKFDPFYVDSKILACIAEIVSQEAINQWMMQDLKFQFKKTKTNE